jgi:hypothetical protein
MTRAATRDASWYGRPSTHGKDLVYHVVRDDIHKGEGACGIPVVATEGFPEVDVTVDAATVNPADRCQRPGCRARWPDYSPTRTYVSKTPARGVVPSHGGEQQ